MTTIKNESKVEEIDLKENHAFNIEQQNKINKEIYNNSLKESTRLKNNLNIHKVDYDDYSKNVVKTEQIDLEKFYETNQQKIEDLLLKKTTKNYPNLLMNRDSLRKSHEVNYPSLRNSIKGKLVVSPSSNKDNKRSKSTKSNKKMRNAEIKKECQNPFSKENPSTFQKKPEILVSEDRATNNLKRSRISKNNEFKILNKGQSRRPSEDKKQCHPELILEIKNNKILNIVTPGYKGNVLISGVSSPNSIKSSNICISENKSNPLSSNTNLLSNNNSSSVNSFRKPFILNKKSNEDPKAYINLINLKNPNFLMNNCDASTNLNAYGISKQQLAEKYNSLLTKDITEETNNNFIEEDLIRLEEKKNILDSKINIQLSFLKEKLHLIKDEKVNVIKEQPKNTKKPETFLKTETIASPIIVKESPKKERNFDLKIVVSPISLTKSLVEEKYEKMVKEICEKRKDTKTNRRNKECSKDFYSKSVEWRKNILDKSMKKKVENEEKEVKQCTFNPCLTDNTKKIIEKKEAFKTFSLYERSVYWKIKNQQNRINENKSKEKLIIESCAFKPTTCNKLNKEEINQVKSDKDYIYKKNVKWLNQIKENRKHMELENQIEIAKDSVHFKKPKRNRNISNSDVINVKRSFDAAREINNSMFSKNDNNTTKSHIMSKDDFHLFTEKTDLFNKLKSFEKEFKDIKNLFDSVESVYQENKSITKNEEIYSKKTIYSVKNTPQRKLTSNPYNHSNNLSRNNGLNKSVTTKEKNIQDYKIDYSYLDKYQKMLENYTKNDKQFKDLKNSENVSNENLNTKFNENGWVEI